VLFGKSPCLIIISVPGGGSPDEAKRVNHAEIIDNSGGYPEVMPNMGDYPCAGLYFKNIERVTLHNVRINAREPDARAAIAAEDIDMLEMSYCSAYSCSALLRKYKTSANILNCSGEILDLTCDQAREWDLFRNMSVNFLNIMRSGAKITEIAVKADLIKTYPADTREIILEKDSAEYLLLTRLNGPFEININNKLIYAWAPPEVYRYYTPVTVALPESGVIKIIVPDGTHIDGEMQLRG